MGSAATALRTAVQQTLEAGSKAIILDLSEVSYVDSAGLGILAAISSQSKTAGATLFVTNLQQRVQQAIELVCLDRTLSIHPTVNAAMALLPGSTPMASTESPSV